MDPRQFTEKVTSLLNAAQQLAQEHSHQQVGGGRVGGACAV